MSSRFLGSKSVRLLVSSDSLLGDLDDSASYWAEEEEKKGGGEEEESLRERVRAAEDQTTRLQALLRDERHKLARLQRRVDHQQNLLLVRERHSSRLEEKLTQLTTGRPEDRGRPAMEVLNLPPAGRGGGGGGPTQTFTSSAESEVWTLRLLLSRREAELREAMKLRHSLTTVLHAVREEMEKSSVGSEVDVGGAWLEQAEAALGEHVTGGVVQGWRRVQSRMAAGLLSGTDEDKLLVQLETELKESRQLVKFQQDLLEYRLLAAPPSELEDCYFLEEWERLRSRRAELEGQRRTFEKERRSFTDAAVRLARERQDFEEKKLFLVKQNYLRESQRSSRTDSPETTSWGPGPSGSRDQSPGGD